MQKYTYNLVMPFKGIPPKILLIMKLVIIIMTACLMQVSATTLAQRITLNQKAATLEKVLRAIHDQSGYNFLYDVALLKKADLVTIDIKNATVPEALERLLKNQPFTFEIKSKTIILDLKEKAVTEEVKEKIALAKVPTLAVAIIPIKGRVTDNKNLPLPGVTVKVKNGKTGAITDNDGRFRIDVPDQDAILIFSFIGFITKELPVSSDGEMTVSLEQDQSKLNEVVVVGYGTQKKENLTGAVATIKSKTFENRPTATPSNLLQGVTAGVAVSASGQGGYPGSTSTIQVRNYATWKGGTDPLFVIDGFTRDKATFDNLNPSDIDNISILKDAASAAIYGMRAGNGVILVTTKSGTEANKEISYNANYTFNSPTRLPKLMNAFEQATLVNAIYAGQGYNSSNANWYADDELEHFKTNSYSPFDDAWKNPWGTNHNLSIRGGSKDIHYFVSGSYLKQGGGLQQSFDKYTVLAKLDGEITKGMTFSLNIDGANTNNKRPNFPYGTDQNMGYFWYYLYYALPYQPGQINGLPRAGSGTSFVDPAVMKTNYRIDQGTALNGNFELKYKIPGISGLAAQGKIGYNNQYSFYKYFNAAYKEYFFKPGGSHGHYLTSELDTSRPGGPAQFNDIVAGAFGSNQYLTSGYGKSSAYQLDLMLTYDKSFGKHSFNAIAGYEPSESNNNSLSASRKNYDNLNYQEINGGSSDNKNWGNSGTSNYYGQASYFGRLDYNYDQKYLLGFTFRRDGDLRFAEDKRWGNFPAVSAGWNIANEDFFKGLKSYAESLKLRASYGITGSNGNIAYWLWQQTYNFNTSSGSLLGSSIPSSITLGTYPNPDVTWEKNYNINLGLDYSFPNRLVNLTVDWWQKKTVDILDTKIASTPITVGAVLPAVNYGKAVAHGIEITLGHENSIGEFHYQVGANWAFSTNKYLQKDQAATVRDFYNQIGKPIDGWITGYKATGIIRTQADADKIIAEKGSAFTIFGYKPAPGMIMYEDIRGPLGKDTPDGKIDGDDATLLSTNGSPRISYGFNANVSWKGFGLSTIFSGFAKYDVMLADGYNGARSAAIYQTNLTVWNDSWTPTNTNAAYPSPYYSTLGLFPASTFWMRNGAFLRLKNVTLSYTVPKKYLQKFLLKGVNAYVSCENLFLWDHVGVYDPELGTQLAYPLMKSVSLGLNVKF